MTQEQKRILVVDDEPDILQLLEISLSRMGLLVHKAESVGAAKYLLEKTAFHLCLSDFKLPDGTGIELVEYIAEKYPATPVAVITAFGTINHAVEALKKGAFDYILKPIIFEELAICLDRIRELMTDSDSDDSIVSSDHVDRIIIQERGRIRLIKKDDIYRVESEGNYSSIFIKNAEKIMLSKNMKKMEDEFFSSKPFLRVHQSHLVNMNFVETIVPSEGFIILENKEEIPLSRSRKDAFLESLLGK